MIKLIKSVHRRKDDKVFKVGEEVDFGKEINDRLILTGYAVEIKKETKERKRTIKKK
tara:strand:+ start:1270 stop:1440 length:171 start_codon:yes stop_codon:yes gene_type:complete